MCSIAIPFKLCKYSVTCVRSFGLQGRFRKDFTSDLLGNVTTWNFNCHGHMHPFAEEKHGSCQESTYFVFDWFAIRDNRVHGF